jgi:hypothetical protein
MIPRTLLMMMNTVSKVVVVFPLLLVQTRGKPAMVVARMLLRLLVLQLKVAEELLIVLEEKDGALGGECVLGGGWLAGGRLPVGPEAGGGDVALVAAAADERTFVVVQTSEIKK